MIKFWSFKWENLDIFHFCFYENRRAHFSVCCGIMCKGMSFQLTPAQHPWAKKQAHLDDEVSAPEVSNGPGQPSPAPHKAKEEGALCVRERFHHLPEPLDQGCRGFYSFICSHRLQKMQWDVWAATNLPKDTPSGLVDTSTLLVRIRHSSALLRLGFGARESPKTWTQPSASPLYGVGIRGTHTVCFYYIQHSWTYLRFPNARS